jgi:hypothetical protein
MSDEPYIYRTFMDASFVAEVEFDEGDTPIARQDEVIEQLRNLSDEQKVELFDEMVDRDPDVYDEELANWQEHAAELGLEAEKGMLDDE